LGQGAFQLHPGGLGTGELHLDQVQLQLGDVAGGEPLAGHLQQLAVQLADPAAQRQAPFGQERVEKRRLQLIGEPPLALGHLPAVSLAGPGGHGDAFGALAAGLKLLGEPQRDTRLGGAAGQGAGASCQVEDRIGPETGAFGLGPVDPFLLAQRDEGAVSGQRLVDDLRQGKPRRLGAGRRAECQGQDAGRNQTRGVA